MFFKQIQLLVRLLKLFFNIAFSFFHRLLLTREKLLRHREIKFREIHFHHHLFRSIYMKCHIDFRTFRNFAIHILTGHHNICHIVEQICGTSISGFITIIYLINRNMDSFLCIPGMYCYRSQTTISSSFRR